MALANFDAFLAAVDLPAWRIPITKSHASGGPFNAPECSLTSLWVSVDGASQGVAPTSAVAPDNTTAGRILHPPTSGLQIITSFNPHGHQSVGRTVPVRASYMLVDRLSHQGGLSGNVNTLQTTNLPTAALTRYTSGVGVYAGIEIYTALGSTDSVVTVTYTNEAGAGSHTGTVLFSNTPDLRAFYIVPLQSGDLGVKSVESVQLSAATGLVGNLGITLFKPLAYMNTQYSEPLSAMRIPGWNTGIHSDACLNMWLTAPVKSNGRSYNATLETTDV